MRAPLDIQAAILKLATERGANKTICPSEVARYLGGEDGAVWRPLMEQIRVEAIQLAQQGDVTIKKGGNIVDPATFNGIYRIAMLTP